MKYTLIVALLCFGCSGQKETAPNLHSEYLNDDVHRKWVAIGDVPIVDIFALMMEEHPDEYHKLNPDLILITDLKKPTSSSHLQSRQTGLVYVCVFEKGDTIIIPNPRIDNFEYEE